MTQQRTAPDLSALTPGKLEGIVLTLRERLAALEWKVARNSRNASHRGRAAPGHRCVPVSAFDIVEHSTLAMTCGCGETQVSGFPAGVTELVQYGGPAWPQQAGSRDQSAAPLPPSRRRSPALDQRLGRPFSNNVGESALRVPSQGQTENHRVLLHACFAAKQSQ